eukprot:scaffold487_cov178-Ochromonas_danica.AAC.23
MKSFQFPMRRQGSLMMLLMASFFLYGRAFLSMTNKRYASTSLLMTTSSSTTIKRNFVKYQGLGNDFILIDNRHSQEPSYSPEQAEKLCNRYFGIGADGVIFALPGGNGCDYTMRIYNSDGSEPQMCGNGIRCMAKFLLELENKQQHNTETTYKIWTKAGIIVPKIAKDGSITVDMGQPVLNPPNIPTTLAATKDNRVVEAPIEALGKTFHTTAVSMGNPHSVIFVESIDQMEPPFAAVGPVLEKHPVFPQRVNTEFVQVINKDHVLMKVWERGAGPTLACGTGACATVVAGVLTGRTNRRCKVTLPGGDLNIFWNESDNHIYMTGPAEPVFRGTIDIPL